MAAIPGARSDVMGASGSQGLLSPRNSWRVYVFPRGAYASQASTGTLITFDSAAVAGRFAAGNWIQAGTAVANIRQVAAVGGNSLSVSGSALTVAENDRIFLIGNTQPTVTGGSATYTTPATTIRQRDDDGSDLYTNSMVTTNAEGIAQFFSEPAVYDLLIQDSNQSNQGSYVDYPVGVAEGVSTSQAATFGATVTISGANLRITGTGTLGVSGWAFFGSSVTIHGALGVTGVVNMIGPVTINTALGVTGTADFTSTVTMSGAATVGGTLSVTGRAAFGGSTVFNQSVGFTGSIVGGVTVSTGVINVTEQAFCWARTVTVDQVIATSSYTVVGFSAEIFDNGGMHSNTVNNSRFTVPAGQGGRYLIIGRPAWQTGSSGSRHVAIWKNGSASGFSSSAIVVETTMPGHAVFVNKQEVTVTDFAVAGDYYEMYVAHNGGNTLSILGASLDFATFSIMRLS